MTPEELRLRLVQIDDEMRSLATDAFARKHELNTEADELRSELAAQIGPELDAASAGWAERAGHKGTHSVNDGEKLAQAAIVSRVDGGGAV